ncbi:hypothetical protein VJ923_01285 [Adlercreutzia sp. R25]|uniref:DUF7724 domain-containing protein n=1 Tax=Adlercreutzia shanghongiae TaxID=3111773 RepID=A0ABU6IY83_9ACTN|nr:MULTISPECIES: hypothetical protein [unclassified Adlercreutzia]MEC4271791.1 hypothetical protein [Adlercreutzia sp. R25]MEC4294798.1 hypothetical protein [Adlercreutzia sp. R22]
MTPPDSAILSSDGNFSCFSFAGRNIRFRTPRSLVRYLDVLEWDHGYLVVNAKYKDLPTTEEYIDLVPILKNLYIDPEWFLAPIKNVKISYA